MLSYYVLSSSEMENVSVKGRAIAHTEPGPGGSGDAQGGVTGGWNLDQWFLGFSFKNELKAHAGCTVSRKLCSEGKLYYIQIRKKYGREADSGPHEWGYSGVLIIVRGCLLWGSREGIVAY